MPSKIEEYISSSIVYAAIWSFGGTIEEQSRVKFCQVIEKIVLGKEAVISNNIQDIKVDIVKLDFKPTDDLVNNCFTCCFSKTLKKWLPWD